MTGDVRDVRDVEVVLLEYLPPLIFYCLLSCERGRIYALYIDVCDISLRHKVSC